MRKIVVATDGFKGTLSSREAGAAVAAGVRRVLDDVEVVVVPVADGGDDTAEALCRAHQGHWQTARVTGPLGDPVEARLAILPESNAAVIDMAAASGLARLTPGQYDPLRASTFGTGELILAALDQGCRLLQVGVGGSATVDGGCGAAQALGVRFITAAGRDLPARLGGGQLDRIAHIDLSARDPRIAECRITVLCDVTNPLCGPSGAARVFAPQKGATPQQVDILERNLGHLAEVIHNDLGIDLRSEPHCGAAGGLAAGLHALLSAKLVSGIDVVLDTVGLDEQLRGADLLVTGEGRLDAQSMMGKVVGVVAARAKTANVPVIAIAGSVAPDADVCRDVLQAAYAVGPAPDTEPPDRAAAAALLTQRTAVIFARHYR